VPEWMNPYHLAMMKSIYSEISKILFENTRIIKLLVGKKNILFKLLRFGGYKQRTIIIVLKNGFINFKINVILNEVYFITLLYLDNFNKLLNVDRLELIIKFTLL